MVTDSNMQLSFTPNAANGLLDQCCVCCNVQEKGSWQEVLRALCALEAVISQGSSAACGEIAVHFQVHIPLIPCSGHHPELHTDETMV